MKKLFFILLFFFYSMPVFSQTIIMENWKIRVDKKSGRFIIYYKDVPVNQTDHPITTYLTVQIGEDIFQIGKDISLLSLEQKENKISLVYRVIPQVMLEINLFLTDHLLVYDEKGLMIEIRLVSQLTVPTNAILRFVFDTAIGEEKGQGYKIPEYSKQEILTEIKQKIQTVEFYPFFIHAITVPTSVHLASWYRFGEKMEPDFKPLLNFRSMRTGKWDPAIGFFYHLGKIEKNVNIFSFFLGEWQKPNRTFPRVKVYYPSLIQANEDLSIDMPLLVENNGDFDIDFYKITFQSQGIKQGGIILTENQLKKGEKKQVLISDFLSKEMKELEGEIKITLWKDQKSYEQTFRTKSQIEIKKTKQKIKEQAMQEAKLKADMDFILRKIDKINLLLYFINQGIANGISEEVINRFKEEINAIYESLENTQK